MKTMITYKIKIVIYIKLILLIIFFTGCANIDTATKYFQKNMHDNALNILLKTDKAAKLKRIYGQNLFNSYRDTIGDYKSCVLTKELLKLADTKYNQGWDGVISGMFLEHGTLESVFLKKSFLKKNVVRLLNTDLNYYSYCRDFESHLHYKPRN